MKKLLLLLFLFPIFAGAQVYQAMPQAGYGPVKRMLFDSVLTLPLGITKLQNLTGGRDVGQIRYNVTDSSLYSYTGYSWRKAGSNLDTTTIYSNLALKLNKSDTAAMLLPYARAQRLIDSVTNLKTSIALKLNISDTAAMMLAAPRVKRFLDSIANLKTSIATKQNTLTLTTTGTSGAATLTGATLNIPQYSGASQNLQQVTDVGNTTTSAIEMNGGTLYMNGGNVHFDIATPKGITWGDDVHTKFLLSPATLQNNTTNYLPDVDGILTTTVNGIATDVSGEITIPTASTSENGILSAADWNTFNGKLNASDTNSLSSRINLKLSKTDTSAMLTPYLKKVDTTGKFITSVFRKVASDSVFYVKGGANTFAFKDSIGSGGGGGSTNIYNTDGSLTGIRTLTLNSQPLYFAGTTTSTFFANGRVTIGGIADAGFKLDVIGGDAQFNNIRVGLGAGGVSTNTVLGYQTLNTNTTGNSNTAVGYQSLKLLTGGYNNNTALGYAAMTSIPSGSNNTAVGSGAMNITTTASMQGNVAIGANAAPRLQSSYNTVIGSESATLSTTGVENTIVGSYAFATNVSGGKNVAVGQSALNKSTGANNTGLGYSAMEFMTGANNTSLGYFSGRLISSGSNNSAADNSIFIGYDTRPNGVSQTNQVVIGYNASGIGSNSTVLGNTSTTSAAIGGALAIQTGTIAAPVASAQLEVNSTTKGFLAPRMTTTQRTAITSPAEGLCVYDLTLHKLFIYDGTLWQAAF